MKSRRQTGRPPTGPMERRSDEISAMCVDVALIYSRVFGPAASLHYFVLADIKAEVAVRIFLNCCRRHQSGA